MDSCHTMVTRTVLYGLGITQTSPPGLTGAQSSCVTLNKLHLTLPGLNSFLSKRGNNRVPSRESYHEDEMRFLPPRILCSTQQVCKIKLFIVSLI